MNLTSFQRPELRDANNNVTQSGTYSVKNGVLTNAQNSGVLDYINNNLQAHQNAIETLQTGALQTKIVTSLPNPSVADANTIYMIKYTSGSDEYYYQYRFIDGSFVRVGDTKIDITDLTNKVTTNTTNIATLSSGKVAKVGDKISGSLGFAGSSMDIYKDSTSSSLYIGNGFAWDKGASINLFGKEHTSSAGVVRIDAHNGTNYSRIELTPSGSLKLNNNTVLTTSNGVAKSGDNMSGSLTFTTDIVAKRNINTDAIALISGTEWNNGGMVKAFGKEYNNYLAGGVELSANNGTDSAKIRILPSGTTECPTPATTDNSTKIATTAFVNSFVGSFLGKLKFANAITSSSAENKTFTFPSNSHGTGFLIIDNNGYTDIYTIGAQSGVVAISKKSSATTPSISNKVLTVPMIAWAQCTLITFDSVTVG